MKAIEYLDSLIKGQEMGSSIPIQLAELRLLKVYIEVQEAVMEAQKNIQKLYNAQT